MLPGYVLYLGVILYIYLSFFSVLKKKFMFVFSPSFSSNLNLTICGKLGTRNVSSNITPSCSDICIMVVVYEISGLCDAISCRPGYVPHSRKAWR